jgi:hypothetical protein
MHKQPSTPIQLPSIYFGRYGTVRALVRCKNLTGSLKRARWQEDGLMGNVVERFRLAKPTECPCITVHAEKHQECTKSSSRDASHSSNFD